MATFLNPDAIKEKSINFDKLNIPSIPTKTSQLTNDSGFLTSSSSINADKLDGKDSTYFAKSSHQHRENDILQGFNSNGISYIDKKGDSIFSCNRLAFKDPNDIFVEYSNDGGNTWIEYVLDDNSKIGLTTIQSATQLYVGNRHVNGIKVTEENPLSDQDMLRITIGSQDRYFNVEKFLVFLSVNSIGNKLGLYLQLEKSTKGATETFDIIYEYFKVSGWSGWNSVSTHPNGATGCPWGSSASSNADKMRFTFKYGQGDGNVSANNGAVIYNIFGYGATLYSKIQSKKYSNLPTDGHLYSYDQSMSAKFPGDILPHITNNKNIGNSTFQWNNVFAKNIYEDGKNLSEIYLATNGKTLKTINGNNLIGDGDIEINDTKVSQTLTTNNEELPLLLKYTSDTNDEINSVKYASNLTYNPLNSILTVGDDNTGFVVSNGGFSSIRTLNGKPISGINGEIFEPFVLDYTYNVSDNTNTTDDVFGKWNLGLKFNMGRDSSSRSNSAISIFANKQNNFTNLVEKQSSILISTGYEDVLNQNNCTREYIRIKSSGEVNISGDKNITLGVPEYMNVGIRDTPDNYNIKLNGKINKLYLPISSDSNTYGYGMADQVLKSNGSTIYWSNDLNTDTKVEQKSMSDDSKNYFYPMLLKYNDNSIDVTNSVKFSENIALNPHKKYLSGITTISPYSDGSVDGCTNNDIVYNNGSSAINIHGSIIETGLKTQIGTGNETSEFDYISIAKIHIVDTNIPGYCNMPIMFQIAARDEDYQNRVHVKFAYPGSGQSYPINASVIYELPWNHEIFLMKESDNLWHLIVHQTSAYDNIDLIRVSIPAYLKNVIKITIPDNVYFIPNEWNSLPTTSTKIQGRCVYP